MELAACLHPFSETNTSVEFLAIYSAEEITPVVNSVDIFDRFICLIAILAGKTLAKSQSLDLNLSS